MMEHMTENAGEWDTITDQTQTFMVAIPRGWQHRVWLVPTPALKHTLAVATSPDGATQLQTGDPSLPMFMEPGAVTFGVPPGMAARPGMPARQLLPEWAHYRYGANPTFRPGALAEVPSALEPIYASVRRAGVQLAWATSARLDYTATESGRDVHGVLLMTTHSFGPMWVAQVHGVESTGDAEPFVPMLLQMVSSLRFTELEQQRQAQARMASAAQHQATMSNIAANTAMMQANHQQNMANIAASGYAHQARMANLQAGYDAQNAAWRDQQAGSDAQQQDFVNTIREERTVIDAYGEAHQVQAGFDRYFYRRHDGTMIGLEAHQQLSDVPGINPADYEELRIQS